MCEDELAFIGLLESQPLIEGQAGWWMCLTSSGWRRHLKHCSTHFVLLQTLFLRKQEFSAAKQEPFTFQCLHYQHIPT